MPEPYDTIRAQENMEMKARVLGAVTLLDDAIMQFGRYLEYQDFKNMLTAYDQFDTIFKAWTITMHGEMRQKYLTEKRSTPK
mgnify:CR=1 FL=1